MAGTTKRLQLMGVFPTAPEGGDTRVTLLEETEFTCDTAFDGDVYYAEIPYATEDDVFTLVAGQTYVVVWNGEEYELTAQAAPAFADDAVILGNGSFLGVDDSGVVFFVGTKASETGVFMVGVVQDTNGPHTIAIYQESTESVLPEVTTADNNKILQVVNGVWTATALADSSVKTYVDEYISSALEGDY